MQLGKLVIDNGYLLATGGLGGVMEFASRGAHQSNLYKKGSVIGVLPSYDSTHANPYVDIAVPTGMGIARNLLLVSMSDAVIAVGGGAGTLSEISIAWQMKKLIVALKAQGWSEKIGNSKMDNKRKDDIYLADNPEIAIAIVNKKHLAYSQEVFSEIGKRRMTVEEASKTISSHYKLKNRMNFLGKGSEGFAFADGDRVYKIIDRSNDFLSLHWSLLSLAERLNSGDFFSIPRFTVSLGKEENNLFISYELHKTVGFCDLPAPINLKQVVRLLRDLLKIGWVISDFQPKNIRAFKNGFFVVSDIGHSLLPYSNYLFESMARRAFVSYKLHNQLKRPEDFKEFLSQVNKSENFSEICRKFGFISEEFQAEYCHFLFQVKVLGKEEILNSALTELISKYTYIKTVLDYGSGHGDIANLLTKKGIIVTAFEPDISVVKQYSNNYKDISIVTMKHIKNLIKLNETFDCVLCSLILCHPLAKTEKKRLDIIEEIMSNIRILAKKYAIVVICNPLYSHQRKTLLQERFLDDKFRYEQTTEYAKRIHSTSRKRIDIHRPMSFYERLFTKYNFSITQIVQTQDYLQKNQINNSDFMIIVLTKEDE